MKTNNTRDCVVSHSAAVLTMVLIAASWMGIPATVIGQTASAAEVLIIRGQGTALDEAEKGLAEECGNDFALHDLFIDSSTLQADITGAMENRKPAIVVLMDNKAISLYKEYQKTIPDSMPVTPSVAIMGVLINQVAKGLRNARCISYEVPVVTAATGLRSVMGKPIVKIGIIHREIMNDFIEKNIGYCRMENFEITPYLISGPPSGYQAGLKRGLEQLFKDKNVDALLVPNDNKLLRPELINAVWLPMVTRFKKPVIVGVEVLASPQINLGTFAIIPDHFSLGKQAAGILFDARDSNWQFGKTTIDPPISVYKIINGLQAKRYFHLGKKALRSVDKVLE